MAAQSPGESPSEDASSSEAAAPGGGEDAPQAQGQSAAAHAAEAGSAGGTTVKIAVYRSSYPIDWLLNDAHGVESLMATWSNGTRDAPSWWPTEGSPGMAVECPGDWSDNAEPVRTGYHFLGWSTDPAAPKGSLLSDLTIPSDAPLVDGDDGAKHLALYAIWTPIEYSVSFDLTKNPTDENAVPAFSWDGKGTFTDLGGGRYRLFGITLDDYNPETGLIAISTPSRGVGGYRFLGWAEPESAGDPAVAVKPAGGSTWYINPVALPYYDYEPVLTARWSLSFDVDVPSQVTFDEYDSLEVEGNLTDSTEKGDIDEESPDAHDRGKQAHFCSQSTATDYKIVGLQSTKAASAASVLTSSDTSVASVDEVLGTGEGTGEKLLSMFPVASGANVGPTELDDALGVHFRLDDTVDMDDARYASFVIPKQTDGFDPTSVDRSDEERLYVAYRLNLDNKVDGAETPNHGLVAAGNVQDGERTRIASVSYEFAVADHEMEVVQGSNCLYIEDGSRIYDFGYIEHAAQDLAANGTASKYYGQFKGYLDAQVTTKGVAGPGPYFQVMVGGVYLPLQLIGICQDTKTSGGKAGLTFQLRDVYAYSNVRSAAAGGGSFSTRMNNTGTNSGGWQDSAARNNLRSTFFESLDRNLQNAIARVDKYQQEPNGTSASFLQKTTNETIWIPSAYEVFGSALAGFNESEGVTSVSGYVPFQYQAYQSGGTASRIKKYNSTDRAWWLRSAYRGSTTGFCLVGSAGDTGGANPYVATGNHGLAPAFCL